MDTERDNDKTSDSAPPSNAVLFRMLLVLKLKLFAGYILDGFAPFVAVIALIVAVMAMNNNQDSHAQLSQSAAAIESLSASLQASKSELEMLKAALEQEKLSLELERKKQDERMTLIIQNVSKLQVKMKVSPTLEDQIHPLVSSSVIQPAIAPASNKSLVLSGANKISSEQIDTIKNEISKFNNK